MSTRRIGELPRDLTLVNDSQDAAEVSLHIGPEAADFDSFFVRIKDGDYVEVWGFEGIVPYNDKLAWRVR